MSTVLKVVVQDIHRSARCCSRHRGRLAVALVWTTYEAPYGGAAIRRTTYACPPCADRARARGEWVYEPIEGERVGTWYYVLDSQRWEVQRRSGEDDFGWYLYGPGGEPFGVHLSRRLGPAKAIAQDYAEDYPGARDWLRAGQGGEVYAERARLHGW